MSGIDPDAIQMTAADHEQLKWWIAALLAIPALLLLRFLILLLLPRFVIRKMRKKQGYKKGQGEADKRKFYDD